MNVKDRRVVICELILCFLVFRDIFVKVLFKYFEVKKIKKRKKRNIFYVNWWLIKVINYLNFDECL